MTRRERRKLRNQHQGLPEISLTPLIDTVLVLLVIFMVSMPVVQQAMKINLPQGDVAEARGKQHDVYVYLDDKKKLYVNTEAVTEDALIKTVQSKMQDPATQCVFVSADGSLRYDEVSSCIGKLKKGGITRVALSTKPVQKTTA